MQPEKFASLFSENAGGKRLTRGANHPVTLTARRCAERKRSRATSAFRLIARTRVPWQSSDMPNPQSNTKKAAPSFRTRYDDLERRRHELMARLAALGERAASH